MGLFADVAKALNPRVNPDEPSHVFRWRQSMAFAVLLALTISIGDSLESRGYFSKLGLPGFASAAQVQNMQDFLKDFRVTQLEEQLDRVRTRQCNAIRMHNQDALTLTVSEMRALLIMYRKVSNYEYRVKNCDELLVPLN